MAENLLKSPELQAIFNGAMVSGFHLIDSFPVSFPVFLGLFQGHKLQFVPQLTSYPIVLSAL